MKNTFKKIVSIVLTVLMVAGMFTMLVPTVSAADEYVTITPNTDFEYNDVTYRFDVVSGHSDSVAKIYADGSIEVTLKNGDMLWFPEVSLESDSKVHAEVTALSTNCEGYFAAFAYGVMGSGSTWTEGMFATVKDAGRLRLCTAKYSTLAGNNGADEKLFDHGGTTIKGTDAAWKDVVNINNAWAQDKTIAFDISKDGNNVTVDFAHPTLGSFGYAYTYDTTSNSTYYFEGGSVGFTSTYATAYKSFRIEEIEVDDFRVGATESEDVEDVNYTEITPNTDFVYNGITYRFDVRDGNTNSYARILADGSIEMKYAYGDILWFPEIKMTDTSAMHAEVTSVAHDSDSNGMGNTFMGVVYGATEKADGSFDTGVAGILRTAARARVVCISRDNLTSLSGGNYGSGGGTQIFNAGDFKSHANYASVKNNNNDWGFNKTIKFDVSRVEDQVTFAMSSADGEFFTTSYDNASYAYAGAVGWTSIWSNNAGYKTYRFDKLTLTNCTVEGEAKDTYTVFDRNSVTEPEPEPELPEAPEGTVYLEKNKTATYKGITYRFDTNKENDNDSWVRVNADGSWEINIRNGDMLWFPDVELTDTSEVYLKITKTGTNTSDYFPGLAYGVTSSTDSTWTSANVSVLRTYQNEKMRFRATAITRANAIKVSGSDYGNGGDARPFNNEFAATALWDLIANPDNKNWNIGATVYHKVSQTSEKVVLEYGVPGYGAFVDPAETSYANNYEGMYAVAGGSVGYTMVWQGNDTAHSQFRIDDITITNCKVGGADKAFYSVKAADTEVKNAQISLSLDGTIGLNFSINATNPKGAIIVAKKNGVEVLNQAVVDGENVVTVPVAAKEMTDDVNFAILVDGEVFEEHSYTTSVAAYANQIMADDNYNEWDELIGAMLNYGAAAQKLLNYKADALAPGASAEVDFDFAGYEAISFSGNTSVLAGLYMNLSLESDTTLKLYIMMADGTKPTVTVSGEPAELVDNGDGYWVLSIGDIAADKLDDDFAIVVNGGAVSFAVNALDWAKIASADADANVANVAKALAAYGVAAGKKF